MAQLLSFCLGDRVCDRSFYTVHLKNVKVLIAKKILSFTTKQHKPVLF